MIETRLEHPEAAILSPRRSSHLPRIAANALAGMLALLFVAAVLIPGMTEYSLWYDEVMVFEGADSLQSPADVYRLEQPARIVHPPLFFILLKGWIVLAGETDFALRAFVALLALVAAGFVYRLGVDLSGHYSGGVAAVVIFGAMGTVSYYTHTVHNYSLLLLTCAALLFFYHRWWTRRQPLYAVGLVVAIALLLYSHYYGIYLIAALNVHALWMGVRQRQLVKWLALQIAAAILFLPWLPVIIWLFTGGYTSSGELEGVVGGSFPTTLSSVELVIQLLLYDGLGIYLAFVGLGLMLAFLRPKYPRRRTVSILFFLLCIMLGSLAAALLVNTIAQSFAPRRVIYVLIPVALLLGGWLVHLPTALRWGALAVFLILTPNQPLPTWMPGNWFYREAVKTIAVDAQPGDAVYIYFSDWLHTPPLRHYAERLLPSDVPFLMAGDDPAQIDHLLWPRGRVWVIEETARPVVWDDLLAQKQFSETSRATLGILNVVSYSANDSPPQIAAQTIENPANLALPQTFGGIFALTACRVDTLTVSPGKNLRLWLDWQALQPPNEDWAFFVHLLDADLATLRGQIDGTPSHRGYTLPTTFWPVGMPIYDSYTLTVNPDTPPGTYFLRIGIYSRLNPLRLTVEPGGEPGANDGLVIARIEVR